MHAYMKQITLFTLLAMGSTGVTGTLEVGAKKEYKTITAANAAAREGDTILVYPRPGNKPYSKEAVFVRVARLTIKSAIRGKRIVVSGKGFEYSGVGSIPRAIFQLNKGTDDCVIEGFDISGAMNRSYNGAGVRINQANNITIVNCEIHHNAMGIMSNGDGTTRRGANQRIINCIIHSNGDSRRPGYNHNLYLGGTSVTLRGCEVHSSVTGHNIKSRAHNTRVEYSYIHDSANREFDLVDSKDTGAVGSDAVLIGNIIAKARGCKGNKTVIHFGQDGGRRHRGTLYMIHNTIVTPYISPVVDLSALGTRLHLVGNIISDGGIKQRGQVLANARNGAKIKNVAGTSNWFSGGFSRLKSTGLGRGNVVGTIGMKLFVDSRQGDYRLKKSIVKKLAMRVDLGKIEILPPVGSKAVKLISLEYDHPAGTKRRKNGKKPVLGALGY